MNDEEELGNLSLAEMALWDLVFANALESDSGYDDDEAANRADQAVRIRRKRFGVR